MKKTPCCRDDGDCPDREAGCHSRCELYREYKQGTDRRREERLKYRRSMDYTADEIQKSRKRRER